MKVIKERKNEDIEENIDDEDLKDLLFKIIVEESNKRIGWDEYFNHKFFNYDKVEFDKVENIIKD